MGIIFWDLLFFWNVLGVNVPARDCDCKTSSVTASTQVVTVAVLPIEGIFSNFTGVSLLMILLADKLKPTRISFILEENEKFFFVKTNNFECLRV